MNTVDIRFALTGGHQRARPRGTTTRSPKQRSRHSTSSAVGAMPVRRMLGVSVRGSARNGVWKVMDPTSLAMNRGGPLNV